MTARRRAAGSAWFSFDEHAIGSLMPGKLADLAVLSNDYFTMPASSIPALESVLTLVGGRPVYASRCFAPLVDPAH